MTKEFYSYLDDFDTIVVLVKKEDVKLVEDYNDFNLLDDEFNFVERLKIKGVVEECNQFKYYLNVSSNIFTHVDYYIEKSNFKYSFLQLGSITRSDLFDKVYAYYGNDLGVTYTKASTTFKVWTPVSKEVYLELLDKKNNLKTYQMAYNHPGVYQVVINGDCEQYRYRFKIRINTEYKYTTDPYSISSTIDKNYSYVLDKNKFYKFQNQRPEFSGIYNDMVVYEASIRDLASFYNEASIKTLHKTGIIDHIQKLGITHVQLMPIYKFYGIDPKDLFKEYNWGYNPEKYNEVEISFSSNMKNPYQAINDLRELIDAFFAKGISVNMDVVYNHVYDLETFAYQVLVPGYFYWYDDQKIRTQFSFCGNDLNSKRAMTRKMISDSLMYWMDTFNMCGFRFDLMGLLDLESVNFFANNIISKYNKAVIYGEGWHMKSLLKNNEKASMNNATRLPNLAFFNDYFRDNIRTKDRASKGFIDGKNFNINTLVNCVKGSNHIFKGSYQSINYIECHDNYTLYDQLKVNRVPDENIHDLHVLGTSLVIISLGIPFLHSGQEIFRSKYLVENSYNSLDIINMIDYRKFEEYKWYCKLIRDLLSIRKEYDVFRRNTGDHIKLYEVHGQNVILKYYGDNYKLYCVVKRDYNTFNYHFKKEVTCIFDGRSKNDMITQEVSLNKPGVYIYKELKNE